MTVSRGAPDGTPPARVGSPDELRDVSTRELLEAWTGHLGHVVDAVHRTATPLPRGRVVAHALDALATGEALAANVLAARWATVADALRFGAPLAHVATALGLTDIEVRVGLRSWADRRLEHDLIDENEHAALLVLIDQQR